MHRSSRYQGSVSYRPSVQPIERLPLGLIAPQMEVVREIFDEAGLADPIDQIKNLGHRGLLRIAEDILPVGALPSAVNAAKAAPNPLIYLAHEAAQCACKNEQLGPEERSKWAAVADKFEKLKTKTFG